MGKVTHSEIDDASGHIWQCQDTSYDEGVAGISTPAAGWPTTLKSYSDCNHSPTPGTTFTGYSGYDSFGNVVATVDPFGAAHSSLYSGNGCQLSTAPSALSPNWTVGHYTACKVYDPYAALATSEQNVLTQNISATYDDAQGRSPTSTTDINGQSVTATYTFDSNGNRTVRGKKPGEPGTYTSQSSTYSTCTFGSNRPCFEIDNVSSLYSNAVTRMFYDAQGRAVETRSPLDASHDTIVFSVYNEWNHSAFQSVPFRVPNGTGWLDPSTAKDENNQFPAGTLTISDPLGQVRAVRDPAEGSSTEPGITCSNLSGTWTSCSGHGLGSPYGDSHLYDYTINHDANNHMNVIFTDVLGRVRYTQSYSVSGSISSNITGKKETQYNVLGSPTAVIVTDMAPQAGQSITSVTATSSYDDMGRLLSISDPDRGNHAFSYDADGHLITDVSGSRTIGTSYDLLGRIRCIQDAAPTTDGSGNCSTGSHPLVQNTFGVSMLGTVGVTDFPVGALTQSVSTTYYPDGTSTRATEKFQHDQRGRVVVDNLSLSVPASWNLTTALPTYTQTLSYNDADQSTTSQTNVGGQAGYTFTQVYDSATGVINGLSNNMVGSSNLITLNYDLHGGISDVNFLAPASSPLVTLANEHFTFDGNMRPASVLATWKSGSGATGTIFSTSRSYDLVGNVSSVSNTQAAVPGQTGSGGSETQNFCYDEQSRLVWAGNSGTQPTVGNGTCGSNTLVSGLSGASYNNGYAYTHLGQL